MAARILRSRLAVAAAPTYALDSMDLSRACAVTGLIALSLVASACSASSKSKSVTSTSAPKTWSIVALGDSVPRGTNCKCTPYPPLTAEGLTTTSGQNVTASNDSVGGATTASVLDQVKSKDDVISHLRSADVVEIEVGANDVGHSTKCGTTVACYEPKVPAIETNLGAIVARVHELASGHKVLVVLLDYWSVWLGGQYAAAKGEAYVHAASELTDQVNAVIKSTATRTGAAYVDLRAAFKGPDYAYDETHYLSSDGDHPNAAGHEQIAAATEAVIQNALHI
jgi:lysophospholipase L1-like esterase